MNFVSILKEHVMILKFNSKKFVISFDNFFIELGNDSKLILENHRLHHYRKVTRKIT